ncbi:MAG: LysE family transporter [Candidatus Daviesbacteria bacterium]|nr:LysE family transporter [Candidatus Daviesbacteria bacterium]
MELLLQIFSAFMLGLIGGATPGPILTSAFAESLRKGFINSLRIIFMAMISEVIVALLILSIFFSFHIPQIIFSVISLIGTAVLIWLALQVWKIKKFDGEETIFSFKKIFLLTVFSGPFWIFWLAICVPQAFLLKQKIAGGQFLFLILFELGWLIATTGLTFLFSRFRPLLTKGNFVSVVFKILALILLFFAIKLAMGSLVLLTR